LIAESSPQSANRFAERFVADRHAILLDIDGTLLDFAPSPGAVHVHPSLRATLATLLKHTGGALALVSGRPLKDIDKIFAPLKLPAIGGHGAELRPAVGRGKVVRRKIPLLEERVRRQLFELAARGIIIEDKGYSIAIHYRLAPERGPGLQKAVDSIVAELPNSAYEILPGKFVIEVKPTGFNKGTAVLELMEFSPFKERRPVFIGDDVTDESVFAVMSDIQGIGFSVGRIFPGVTGVFREPADVREWLARIAAKASA
jgi:trehalose 6-phosphate phosphatase